MRRVLFILTLSFCSLSAITQVVFSEQPLDSAIVPRNFITNKGIVKISGTVNRTGTPYAAIKVREYRNNILKDSFNAPLVYDSGLARFSFSMSIKAELANYQFKVYGIKTRAEVLLQNIKHIAAGDAFIIQGQSNAAAGDIYGSSNAENQSDFIRVWGSGNSNGYVPRWNIANGDIWDWGGEGNAGQWALRLARKILDTFNIPVVIFNGANSGEPISWFQPDSSNLLNQYTNYGRLLKRVKETGFNNNIRAIFWYQGESDSYTGNDINVYKTGFYNLYNSWVKNYPGFEHLYIIQIKQGCGQPAQSVNKIQQAHLELANEIPNTTLYATNGTEHAGDACHYYYNPGYRTTAEYLFPLVNRDIYKAPDTLFNIESPQIERVVQTSSKQLTLYFKNKKDSYTWERGTENDFVIEGTSSKITVATIVDSTLTFLFNKAVTGVQNISFQGHVTGGSPCVRNINGEGLTGFYKMPVSAAPVKNSMAVVKKISLQLSVNPNPVHSKLVLQYSLSKPSTVFIVVVDFTGKVIRQVNAGKQLSGSNSITIIVDDLAKGLYLVKLQGNDFTATQKFIKE